MAKCTACRKPFPAPFWRFTTLCPECKSAQGELHAQLEGLTPVFIVTPCLVGVNVLVFILMVASGVSLIDPDTGQLISWGASFGVLTLGSQPWRVFTSMFVHIGIIHLLFNMWCLWSLGRLAERLMGNWNFLILYLLSGAGGSLVSLWLHPQLVCAGASGAIFGVAGGLVAILSLKKAQIPGPAMKRTLKSVLFFVGYNLLYGMQGGIDNAAHLGGVLSGALLGLFMPERAPQRPLPPWLLRSPYEQESSRFKMAGAMLACLLILGFGFVRRGQNPSAGLMQLELLKLGKEDRANLQEAAKLTQAGKTDPAIEKLKTITAHAPASSVAHMILAEAYLQKKENDQAIEEFQKAVELQPNLALAHVELGIALRRSGRYDQAIVEYRKALDLEPNNAAAHVDLGLALRHNGQNEQAIAEYHKALALRPDDPEANNDLGYALAKMGRYDEAIPYIQKALQSQPDDALALDSLAYALAGKGQYEAAIEKYRQALNGAPNNAVIHLHFSQALAGMGRAAEARNELAEAIRLDPQIQNGAD